MILVTITRWRQKAKVLLVALTVLVFAVVLWSGYSNQAIESSKVPELIEDNQEQVTEPNGTVHTDTQQEGNPGHTEELQGENPQAEGDSAPDQTKVNGEKKGGLLDSIIQKLRQYNQKEK